MGLKTHPEAYFVKVKVHPDSRENRLVRKKTDTFDVYVREPAEQGRANAAVLRLLAAELGIPTGKLWIIKGAQSPSKIIKVLP